MKNKTCCFSGHRHIPEAELKKVREKLYQVIDMLINEGIIYFGSGGALGFDTLAAETVLDLKKKYPHIKLIMVYPCKEQTRFWKSDDIEKYIEIKRQSDKVVYVSESYDRECMFKRNRHLVDCSCYCICYLTKNVGGTAYTVNYAQQKRLGIINIAQWL